MIRSLGVSVTAVAGLLHVALTPVFAESVPGAYPTQHALEELANALAQGKITRTPTPSPTLTLTPTATVTSTATLVVTVDTPTVVPTAAPEPCWLLNEQGDVIFVPNDDETAYIPIPCPPDDLEVVVEQVDTPTVVPTDTPPTPAPAAAQSVVYITLPAPPAQVIHEVQYVQVPGAAEPEQPTPTAFPTPTLTPTPSPTTVPTLTPTLTPTVVATARSHTATPTIAPTRVPLPVAVAVVQRQPAPAPRPSVPHGPPPPPFTWDRHTPDPRWNYLEDDQDEHAEEHADA